MGASNLDETMSKEGYVPAYRVSNAVGVALTTVHRWIDDGTLRGRKLKLGKKRTRWFVLLSDAIKKLGGQSPTIKKQLQALS